MAIAIDESKPEEERLVAFDDMELLWEPILNLTTSPIPTISAQALSVIGTAVEYKPDSQTTHRSLS
ncbi:hypothetical protein FRC04_003576 [Tulasnella sp. 424]|nr:hypothetical protein FRC04_003576 [Tulasnella sp. 424]